MRIAAGRHPVIEKLAEQEASRFIPNDLYLDGKEFIAVITGPNMGGNLLICARPRSSPSWRRQARSCLPAKPCCL
jgi:DNA mismatch repair protein MutS